MKGPSFSRIIWLQATIRLAIYPLLLALSGWAVWRTSTAAAETFWSLERAGSVILAAALSSIVMACIRLGDGRFETEKGKTLARNPYYAAHLWLAAFLALSGSLLLFAALHRLPEKIEGPWFKSIPGPLVKIDGAPQPSIKPSVSHPGGAAGPPSARPTTAATGASRD